MAELKIIDVSKHNGIIDWGKVKNCGVDGVIIRGGYGRYISQTDPMFEKNYSGASEAGLHIGAYWYSYAMSAEEAKKEAEVFLSVIKGKKFDLPLYIDIEDKTQLSLSKKVCSGIVTAFADTLEKAGYFAGVYSFDSFFGSNLSPAIPKRYAAWVARVENVPPKNVAKWGMHQYSWKGKIDGINGFTDLSRCVVNYPKIITEGGFGMAGSQI